jgi:hypothetical protein
MNDSETSPKQKTKIQTIGEIRKEVGHFSTVIHLANYPKEDLYIQVMLDNIPFNIERGHDQFFYNGYKTGSKRQLWYVSKNDREYPELYIEKGFTSIRNAIDATVKKYQKELSELTNNMNSIKKLLSEE